MMHYADELATSGALLHVDELIAYILAGMEGYYNSGSTTIRSLLLLSLGSAPSPPATSTPNC
jgi:hypothetical protein